MNELGIKASKIKLVAFDVDGVLTDGKITYTDSGEEIKTFDVKDGQGMVMLKKNDIITAVITARKSPIIDKRVQELGICHSYQGIKNKLTALEEIIGIHNLDYSEIAYVGDDLPDVCILERVGLSCCPAD